MNKSPALFPMAEPNHFSDYGFDPQIDFFQGLDQASMSRRNRRGNNIHNNNSSTMMARSAVDHSAFHFKLQKPISKDELRRIKKKKQNHDSTKWWQTAFLFFRKGLDYTGCRPSDAAAAGVNNHALIFIGSSSTSSPPVSLTASTTTTTPPSAVEEEEIPYVNLRELNMETQVWRNSTSAMPLYLVT